MRRAIHLALFALVATLGAAPAGAVPSAGKFINAVEMVDYSRPPKFKVGDWVRYHYTGRDDHGVPLDTYITLLIAGEERFWGDDCVWIETRDEEAGGTGSAAVASLVSYSAFTDTLASRNIQIFIRKEIPGVKEDGTPDVVLYKQPRTTVRQRRAPAPLVWVVDTVGPDTVQAAQRLFKCLNLRLRQGMAEIKDLGDSTIRTEVAETRVMSTTDLIPITHFAHETIDHTMKRRSWLIGHSEEAPELHLLSRGLGDGRIEAFGHGGLESGLVPEQFRKSLDEQDAAARRSTIAAAKRRMKRS